MTQPLSFPREKIHIVLLEGISETAVENLRRGGYSKVTHRTSAAEGHELQELLSSAHMVGIRSRTRLTEEVFQKAPRLMAVGAFCIGTNQIDLEAAARAGIPVFNAPHSNTRSVAELVVAELVMLHRGIPDKNAAAHAGRWKKSAAKSHELRGRTLGIVGYGHIGSQVSVLAEAFGMRVLYYDVVSKLPLGNARQLSSLSDLLAEVDAVTLHVPAAADTVNLLSAERIQQLKPGAFVINASRGNVVDLEALAEAIRAGRVGGAAIDVYPEEPRSATEPLRTPLQGLENVILTPHIGGSTLEAQHNIGIEVSSKLVQYSDLGATIGAVNFPNISLSPTDGTHRVLHIHENRPGILSQINRVEAESDANVLAQYLKTNDQIGYVVMDVDRRQGPDLLDRLKALPGTLRARILY